MKYQPNFTPLAIFRRLSTGVLMGYFVNYHKVLDDFPWSHRWPGRSEYLESLLEEYQKLPEAKRAVIEEELAGVNGMGDDDSQETLRAACERHKILWDNDMLPEDRALRILMENKDAFRTAADWCSLENYQGFSDYFGPDACDPKPYSKIEKTLANFFREYLKTRSCGQFRIDYYSDAERHGYLVTYESHPQNIPRFDKEGKLIVKPERPLLESLMIYYHKTGKLKVKTRGEGMAKFIRDTFARVALDKTDFFEKGPAAPVYNFDRFRKAKNLTPLAFDLDIVDGMDSVKVTTIYFRPDGTTRDTITVHSTRDLAERIRALGIDLAVADIKKVCLQIKFSGGRGKGRTRTVRLSIPSRNNLGDTRRDRIIQKCLKKWNLETVANK